MRPATWRLVDLDGGDARSWAWVLARNHSLAEWLLNLLLRSVLLSWLLSSRLLVLHLGLLSLRIILPLLREWIVVVGIPLFLVLLLLPGCRIVVICILGILLGLILLWLTSGLGVVLVLGGPCKLGLVLNPILILLPWSFVGLAYLILADLTRNFLFLGFWVLMSVWLLLTVILAAKNIEWLVAAGLVINSDWCLFWGSIPGWLLGLVLRLLSLCGLLKELRLILVLGGGDLCAATFYWHIIIAPPEAKRAVSAFMVINKGRVYLDLRASWRLFCPFRTDNGPFLNLINLNKCKNKIY